MPSGPGGRSAAVGVAGAGEGSPAGAAGRRAGRAHLQGVSQAGERLLGSPKSLPPSARK